MFSKPPVNRTWVPTIVWPSTVSEMRSGKRFVGGEQNTLLKRWTRAAVGTSRATSGSTIWCPTRPAQSVP